jgi:ApaG protein
MAPDAIEWPAALPMRPDNPYNRAMNERSSYTIDVQVEPRFVPDQSRPGDNRYVFAYTITLHNAGDIAARLLTRHWVITDANGKVEEVTGEGVVGEQPWIRPGDEYEYTSGAVLETSVGIMQGSYQMLADDGTHFEAAIPPFTLSIPRTLH